MSTFNTSFQHGIVSPRHSDQTKIRNERHPNWEGVKLSSFADDMIAYIEYSMDSTKNLLDFINEFDKRAGFKVLTQKQKAFLYINYERSE